jgi:hypothetical protein
MEGDGSWKWRRAQEYRVNDVEEAIETAERFRRDGIYNWFRGQTKPWPPYTTLTRLHRSDKTQVEQVREQLGRLEAFMKVHPELRNIAEDTNAFYAVAQHYGIPTNYLDFTTEPAIAGFFACDTHNPEPGNDSCIYC